MKNEVEKIFISDKEPIESIQWFDVDELNGNDYNPNMVFGPELRLLERNLLSLGWVQPIMINRDKIIIDGFHRWSLSKNSESIRARWNGKVPCVVMDVDRPTAMILTIRMNRAKGSHSALRMSDIVRELVETHGIDKQVICNEIGATMSEIELLSNDTVFTKKNIDKYEYRKAWYPAVSNDKNVGIEIDENEEIDEISDSSMGW